eukprot:m.231675 g.231675  ORF g.231675 m.231675 type:complete len:67 (-) comp15699_c2_seq1:2064-2264(-)
MRATTSTLTLDDTTKCTKTWNLREFMKTVWRHTRRTANQGNDVVVVSQTEGTPEEEGRGDRWEAAG